MMTLSQPFTRRWLAPMAVCLALILFLLALPTGFEDAIIYQGADRCAARVLSCDNSAIKDTGLVRSGEQLCQLELLGGKFQGQTVQAYNLLNGSLEQDKLFAPGDKALVMVSHQGGEILSVNMVDHYRLGKEAGLALAFALLLILVAGWTGLRAIFSFVLTVLALWKVLIPLCLKGWNPIWVGLAVVLLLTLLIIALVYGFDRRCAAAVSGATLGVVVTAVLGCLCTDLFQIHGAIMSGSESLLYSGYQQLNLTRIFMASIFLGSAGAVMDLAVDITSAIQEVVEKKPGMGWQEATRSGMNVGRAAMGTMTTTLLFAYSGGFLALLMVFMAQGTPLPNILNYKYVSAELIDTVVGSFGLVTVAPLTALTAGILLTRRTPPTSPSSAEGSAVDMG